MFHLLVSATVICLGASVSAATDKSFGLYAYGDSVGGLPLFYDGGKYHLVEA